MNIHKHSKGNLGKSVNTKLTDRQNIVLHCVKWWIEKYGYPPTYREICAQLDIGSTNAAHNHMLALEKKGYVQLGSSKARAIKVLPVSYVIETSFKGARK